MLRTCVGLATALWATQAASSSDFGTEAEAQALATQLIQIINNDGIEAAADAVIDPNGPFRFSRMGVNLFESSFVIADNREPETVAADYSAVADLTGELVWPRISEAAGENKDVELKWYHYDTQEPYWYKCYSMRASRDDGAVMVCR